MFHLSIKTALFFLNYIKLCLTLYKSVLVFFFSCRQCIGKTCWRFQGVKITVMHMFCQFTKSLILRYDINSFFTQQYKIQNNLQEFYKIIRLFCEAIMLRSASLCDISLRPTCIKNPTMIYLSMIATQLFVVIKLMIIQLYITTTFLHLLSTH